MWSALTNFRYNLHEDEMVVVQREEGMISAKYK